MNPKAITLAVALAILPLWAYAADKPSRQLAEEYVNIIDFQKITTASLNSMDQQVFSHYPPQERAALNQMMATATGWPAIKDKVIAMIMETYTKEELEAYIAFVKTPAGASGNAKNEMVSARFSEILGQNMQNVLATCCAPQQ